jgi:hypothetical protein
MEDGKNEPLERAVISTDRDTIMNAMQTRHSTAAQSHADAGDGVERTVTQARGGVRRGMLKVLLISMVLAVAGIGVVLMITGLPRQHAASTRGAAPAVAGNANSIVTETRDGGHLGANGLEKCEAFRLVIKHTQAFQAIGGGTISAAQRSGLQEELSIADAMPPKSLTPAQCGAPL